MKKEDNKAAIGGGISFVEALQLIFIVLKLTGAIKWSWWLVLLPTLIPLGIAIIMAIILVVILRTR